MDTTDRAIPTLEGQNNAFLDGDFSFRKDAIYKCYQAASNLGYSCFALQNGGWCVSSSTACSTYAKHGSSSGCLAHGKGGNSANQVYTILGI